METLQILGYAFFLRFDAVGSNVTCQLILPKVVYLLGEESLSEPQVWSVFRWLCWCSSIR